MLGRYKDLFNRQLLGAVLLVNLSVFNYGFDNQGFATTQAMDPFQKQFGDYNAETGKYSLNTIWLSLFSGLIFIGFAAGILLGSIASARFGRRKTMLAMSLYEIVTATIIVTSTNRNQILAGRILNYVYIGVELAVIPVFQSEIVPTEVRGLVVAAYQFSLIFGGLIMNIICLGTSTISDNRAWRIPFGLFYIIPTIIASGIMFLPESPRWLMIKGRNDEAMESLRKFRSGAFTEERILEEYDSMRIGLELEKEKGSFWELFQGVNLKRTFIACSTHGFQNGCGQDLVSKFGSLIVKSLGTVSPFILTVVFAISNLIAVGISMLTADKVGRRPLLMLSAFLQLTAMLSLGGIGTTGWPLSKHYQPVAIGLLVVETVGFSIGFAPLTNVVATEVTALRLRDQTQRLSCTMNVFANLVVGLVLPILLDVLELQVGFVFAPICFLALLFVIFFVPECKGKSLEQIDYMFHEKVPLLKFGSYQVPDMQDVATSKVHSAAHVEQVA